MVGRSFPTGDPNQGANLPFLLLGAEWAQPWPGKKLPEVNLQVVPKQFCPKKTPGHTPHQGLSALALC